MTNTARVACLLLGAVAALAGCDHASSHQDSGASDGSTDATYDGGDADDAGTQGDGNVTPCEPPLVDCNGECIDPLNSQSYCGASGDCLGSNAGQVCDPWQLCGDGTCTNNVDLFVALDGSDGPSCGAMTAPCRTVKYTAEERANTSDLIGVMPGTYDEVGAIDIPKGVSLIGLGSDASTVVLRPEYDMGSSTHFVNLTDADLSQDGSQSLSYLTFEGHSQSFLGSRAVHVQNRSNVRIHHCRFTNWDREYLQYWAGSTITVDTTYDFGHPTHEWRVDLPNDLGGPGDYTTWVDWPTDPIVGFEFDHNFVYRCGSGKKYTESDPVGSDRAGRAMKLINVKDSGLHHNEFDLRGVYAAAITGIGAYWNNVDIHNNVFRATNAYAEGWMGPSPPWKALFVVEVWGHINGCEYYNNISNDGFSIMDHKETSIRNNILVRHASESIGIEFGFLHHSEVRNNYILGGEDLGMAGNWKHEAHAANGSVYGNIVIGVRNWGISMLFNGDFCDASSQGMSDTALYNNVVDSTYWGSIRVGSDCQTTEPPAEVYIRNNILMGAENSYRGITFEMAPEYGAFGSVVENNLFFNNSGGTGTSCRCNDTDNSPLPCVDGCDDREAVASISDDPLLDGPDIIIVNNDDSAQTSHQGEWAAGNSEDVGSYRDDVLVHAGGAGDYFEFQAQGLPATTPTLVAIWWPRNFGQPRSEAVQVSVYNGAGATPMATYTIDQSNWDSSEWYYLGMHVFSSGTSRVRVHSVDGAQVVADAVLWSKLGAGYKLLPGSPAINAGSAAVIGVVNTDFFGNPVPSGPSPDIGIHERP